MVLKLAVAAGCTAIVTHNRRGFRGADRFGVDVWTPSELLNSAVGEKVAALRTVDYLRERVKRGSRKAFDAVLAKGSGCGAAGVRSAAYPATAAGESRAKSRPQVEDKNPRGSRLSAMSSG